MAIKYKIGTNTTTITDIQATSGREINYAKTSSGTYLWSRPTSIDLQFPWEAFKSWTLTRLAGSKNPNATQGTVWSNGSKATSGTNTYSFSNVYYGDKLKFAYTAKPGAVVDQDNNYEFTVDPTFSISNIQVEKSVLPEPTAELSSQWDFKEGTWSTVKATSNRSEFKVKITKPDVIKSLAVNVYVDISDAEAFYRHNLNVITYEDDSIPVYCGDTLLPQGTSTLIGTIAAGTAKKEFTLKVVDSSYNYCWPKGVKLTVKLELNSADHYFTSNFRSAFVSKGTFKAASSGGGGTGGGGYTGGGGTGYGSRW